MILSDYGSAQVNSDGAWDGANTKNYSMDPGTFTAVFTGKQNVAQPAGSNPASVSYEVDSVTVNGTQVNVAGNSMWTAGADTTSGTLAFTANGGENYTVVVTFKPVGKDPIFAKLEVVNRTGHGGTVPTGTTIQNVGLPVNVDIEPDSGWKIYLHHAEPESGRDGSGCVVQEGRDILLCADGCKVRDREQHGYADRGDHYVHGHG